MGDDPQANRLASLRETYATLDLVEDEADPMRVPLVAAVIDEVERQISVLESDLEGEE